MIYVHVSSLLGMRKVCFFFKIIIIFETGFNLSLHNINLLGTWCEPNLLSETFHNMYGHFLKLNLETEKHAYNELTLQENMDKRKFFFSIPNYMFRMKMNMEIENTWKLKLSNCWWLLNAVHLVNQLAPNMKF